MYEWLRYANQGATRNQPLSPQLLAALQRFAPQMGLQVEVFSGGQPGKGTSAARVGSVRHDHGNAADVFFLRNGRRLDWANPQDTPVFQDIVRQGRAAGLTGFGAGPGYMQAGSMHIGFGSPGVWGAGGRGANAPGWLVEAFRGAKAGAAPAAAAAPQMPTPTMAPRQAPVPGIMPVEQPGPAPAFRGPFIPPSLADMLLAQIPTMQQSVQIQRQQTADAQAEQDAAEQQRRIAMFSNLGSFFG